MEPKAKASKTKDLFSGNRKGNDSDGDDKSPAFGEAASSSVVAGRRMRSEQQLKKKANCDIPQSLPLNKDIQVMIAHVNNLNDFYVIKRDDLDTLENIKLGLASIMPYGGLQIFQKQFSKIDVGVIKFSSSDFRRVKILKEYEKTNDRKVLFIDYGNTEKCDYREVKVLAGGYQTFHPMAIHCSMDILPPFKEDGRETKQWRADIIKMLREEIDDKNKSATDKLDGGGLYARSVRKERGVNFVQLKPNIGEDWGSLLVENGFARKMEFLTKPKFDSDDEFDYGTTSASDTTTDNESNFDADDEREGDGY